MTIRWTRLALNDFEQAHDFIAQDDPESAHKIAQRILDATGKLLKFPRIGRIGEDEDTWEWIVPKTPYMLIYTIKEDAIELLWVWGICPRIVDKIRGPYSDLHSR